MTEERDTRDVEEALKELACWAVWEKGNRQMLGHRVDGDGPSQEGWKRIGSALTIVAARSTEGRVERVQVFDRELTPKEIRAAWYVSRRLKEIGGTDLGALAMILDEAARLAPAATPPCPHPTVDITDAGRCRECGALVDVSQAVREFLCSGIPAVEAFDRRVKAPIGEAPAATPPSEREIRLADIRLKTALGRDAIESVNWTDVEWLINEVALTLSSPPSDLGRQAVTADGWRCGKCDGADGSCPTVRATLGAARAEPGVLPRLRPDDRADVRREVPSL